MYKSTLPAWQSVPQRSPSGCGACRDKARGSTKATSPTLSGKPCLRRLIASLSRSHVQRKRPSCIYITVDTLNAHVNEFDGITTWCVERDLKSLPAEPATLAAYIDHRAETHKPASIPRAVASIAHGHRAAELPDPTQANPVKLALKRLGRQHSCRQDQAAPLGELGVERVLATGGLAGLLARDSTQIEEVDEFLTLTGLRMLYERNR
ncbi:hypothetical protein WCLP8_3490005 [uncultured Gammaproteobacteria bacterium]